MFFFLSKILTFLLVPFNWCLLLLISGLLIKNKRICRVLLISSATVFLIFSNSFLFQVVINNWEPDLSNSKHLNSENLVVLGGMSSYHDESSQIFFSEAADRLLQTLPIFFQSPDKNIVLSGGSAKIFFKERPESDYLHEYLKQIGINSTHIFTENKSRNTYENALYTKALFDSTQLKKDIMLITSAFHMKRAKACFEKQGFIVHPHLAHSFRNCHPLKPDDYVIPSLYTLQRWPILIKEWMGILVYRIKGYL